MMYHVLFGIGKNQGALQGSVYLAFIQISGGKATYTNTMTFLSPPHSVVNENHVDPGSMSHTGSFRNITSTLALPIPCLRPKDWLLSPYRHDRRGCQLMSATTVEMDNPSYGSVFAPSGAEERSLKMSRSWKRHPAVMALLWMSNTPSQGKCFTASMATGPSPLVMVGRFVHQARHSTCSSTCSYSGHFQ